MVIGIDMDDLLADFVPAFAEFHNSKYGTSLARKDFFSYKFWEVLRTTEEEAIRKVFEFYQTDLFRSITTVPGAVKGIERLRQGNQLAVVTSRPYELQEETNRWLERHFPGAFSKVYLTKWGSKTVMPRMKSEICLKAGIARLAEDNLIYATECAARGIRVWLLDCPWNQGELPHGISRVYSWEQLVEEIQG